MIASTLVLLSFVAVAIAIVIPTDPIGPINPGPLPIFNPCPPTCNKVHCPPGYHCVLQQHVFCFVPPCNFPKEPTCVKNIIGPIG